MIFSTPFIWFLAGAALLVAELLAPGVILIFFAAGSWITAAAVWMIDMDLTTQIIVFMVSSLSFLFTLRKYCLKTFKGGAVENADAVDNAVGKAAVVTKRITPAFPGEIKFTGSFWRAVAEVEIEEGQAVSIEGRESEDALTFRVKPFQGENR